MKKGNREIQYIKNILELLYGRYYDKNEKIVEEIATLYVDHEEQCKKIDFNKIDTKKITLLAYYYYHSYTRDNQKERANRLFKIIKNQKYIKPGDCMIMFLEEDGRTVFLNSDIEIFDKKDEELERNYSEDERILLRGYSRIIPVKELINYFLCGEKDKKNLLTLFMGEEEEKNSENLYKALIKTIKRSGFSL